MIILKNMKKIIFLILISCLSLNAKGMKSKIIFPVRGEIGKDFFIFKYPAYINKEGMQTDGFGGNLLSVNHRGTDFAPTNINKDLVVQSVCKGVVIKVDNRYKDDFSYTRKFSKNASYGGNSVTIKSPEGWFFHYCHLKQNSIKVKLGEKIEQGQKIGLIGMSGKKIRIPHVHFSIRNNKRKVINSLCGELYNTYVERWKPLWYDKLFEGIKKNYKKPNIVMGSIYNKNIFADKILLSAFKPSLNNKVVKNFTKLWCIVHGVRANDLIKARVVWYIKNRKVKQNFEAIALEDAFIQKIEWKVMRCKPKKVKIRFSIYRDNKMMVCKYVKLS